MKRTTTPPTDTHPCFPCKHFVRLGGHNLGMPMCAHAKVRQEGFSCATVLPKDAPHPTCAGKLMEEK